MVVSPNQYKGTSSSGYGGYVHGHLLMSLQSLTKRKYVGHVQNALQLRFLIFGRYAESLTLVQKIAGFGDQLAALLVLLPVVVYLGVPLALLSGHPFIIWSTTEQLKWLIRAVSVQQICSELHRWSLKAIIDFAHLQTSIQVEGWLLPCKSQNAQVSSEGCAAYVLRRLLRIHSAVLHPTQLAWGSQNRLLCVG